MSEHSLHDRSGLRYTHWGETELPWTYDTEEGELALLRKQAVCIDLSPRGRIWLEGAERLTFLQGLFTNDVVRVPEGRGVYGAFLTAKGRMLADARVYPLADGAYLDVEPGVKQTVLDQLDKYHFTEKVTWSDRSGETAALRIAGPRAPFVFDAVFPDQRLPEDLVLRTLSFEGSSVLAVGQRITGEPGADLVVSAAHAAALFQRLQAAGCRPCGWGAMELARIEAGVPRFGAELTQETIPLEAGLEEQAVSYTKGCYIGQEIIARMSARGTPAKRLVGFSVQGEPLAAGTPITKGGRAVGEIRSSIRSPSLRGRVIALGYVHKSIEDADQELQAGGAQVLIVPLPFYPPRH